MTDNWLQNIFKTAYQPTEADRRSLAGWDKHDSNIAELNSRIDDLDDRHKMIRADGRARRHSLSSLSPKKLGAVLGLYAAGITGVALGVGIVFHNAETCDDIRSSPEVVEMTAEFHAVTDRFSTLAPRQTLLVHEAPGGAEMIGWECPINLDRR